MGLIGKDRQADSLRMELLERVSEMGITVLVVTHEHELVRRFNRRTITLKHGRIISDVPASFGEEVHV